MVPKQQRYILLGALVAALAVTGLFTVRTLHMVRHMRGGPAEEIRPWMPIPYIAHSHHVPPHILVEALGLKMDSPDSRGPIEAIARRQNIPVSDVIVKLDAAIKQFHASPPGPPPPPTPRPPQDG